MSFEVRLKIFLVPNFPTDLEDFQYKYKKATQKDFDENSAKLKVTKKMLCDYMNRNNRAKEYFNSLASFDGKFTNARCEDCVLKATYKQGPKPISQLNMHKYLLIESLEDGIYSGYPGNAGLYPTKTGKYEYGYIDYRKKENIRIKLLKSN
jgi:hypothetical protein